MLFLSQGCRCYFGHQIVAMRPAATTGVQATFVLECYCDSILYKIVVSRPRFSCQPSRASRAPSTKLTGRCRRGVRGSVHQVYISPFSLRRSLQNKTVASNLCIHVCGLPERCVLLSISQCPWFTSQRLSHCVADFKAQVVAIKQKRRRGSWFDQDVSLESWLRVAYLDMRIMSHPPLEHVSD